MIAFEPTDDQKMMVDSVAQLAKALRARDREIEKARAVPDDLRKKAHELGVALAAIPEASGGAGLGLLTAVMLEEEIANGDPGAAFGLAGPAAYGLALTELATPEQAAKWIAPFAAADGWTQFGAVAWGERKPSSQRAGLLTTAVKRSDTWELTGEKAYVVNADRAESFVAFAQTSEAKGWRGIGAFVVPKSAPGLTIMPRETSLGLDAASFGGIKLDGVEVEETDRLAGGDDFDAALLRFFSKYSLVIAARATGLARAAFDTARAYCETRKAFGKPIGHFQAVAFNLADRSMDVDASRAMVWRAAHAWDTRDTSTNVKEGGSQTRAALLATARAAAFAQEAAMRCGDDAVQLHGGAGFIRDYPVEKWMRDAKQLQVCAMTAGQSDQLAAAIELGRDFDAGDVLPCAESQSTFV